jgi:GNAT superfamily N-acetyltransferase
MEIRPLTPELWPAFETWFASRDTSSDARGCWCMWWRRRGLDFSNTTAARNRAQMRELTDRAAAEGTPTPGLVAIDDGRVIGWISIGPRTDFERLERSRTIPRLDDRPVWSIVCFVVGRSARGRGVTRSLLDGAIEHARANGATALEAYPADPGDERLSTAAAYTGLLTTFEAASFRKVADTTSRTGAAPRVVVRLELGAVR